MIILIALLGTLPLIFALSVLLAAAEEHIPGVNEPGQPSATKRTH